MRILHEGQIWNLGHYRRILKSKQRNAIVLFYGEKEPPALSDEMQFESAELRDEMFDLLASLMGCVSVTKLTREQVAEIQASTLSGGKERMN